MSRLVLFNKPYDVLSQFTDRDREQKRLTLSDFIAVPDIYPAGRLDKDSEGLLVLTDNGKLQSRITRPHFKLAKTYWVQVEGQPTDTVLAQFKTGIDLKDGKTRPAAAMRIAEPKNLWPRTPPIRIRKTVPDTWLEITLKEGRNRQVRRMTAAIGHPTLRLIRYSIGNWTLDGLAPGTWREIDSVNPRP